MNLILTGRCVAVTPPPARLHDAVAAPAASLLQTITNSTDRSTMAGCHKQSSSPQKVSPLRSHLAVSARCPVATQSKLVCDSAKCHPVVSIQTALSCVTIHFLNLSPSLPCIVHQHLDSHTSTIHNPWSNQAGLKHCNSNQPREATPGSKPQGWAFETGLRNTFHTGCLNLHLLALTLPPTHPTSLINCQQPA